MTDADDIRFIWGQLDDDLTPESIESHSLKTGETVVFLDFGGPIEDGPTNIILVHQHKHGVTLSENCELWAIPRSDDAEILTANHRFRLDDGRRLRRSPNRLDAMRARRVAMAHDRWRALAAERAKERPGSWKVLSIPPSPPRSGTSARSGACIDPGPQPREGGSASAFPLRGAVAPSSAETAAAAAVASDPARHEARLNALQPTWEAWSTALQDLMRHPDSDAQRDRFLMFGGYARGEERREKLLSLPRRHTRSVVYLQVDEPFDDGPLGITVVLLSQKYDKVIHGCEVVAADDTSPIQLVAGNHRVTAGEDGRLTLGRSRERDLRPDLQARARERWRSAAMARLSNDGPDGAPVQPTPSGADG